MSFHCLRQMRTRVFIRFCRGESGIMVNHRSFSSLERQERLVIRKATLEDKQKVLDFRQDFKTSRMNYLEPKFNFFIQDKKRQCFVGEIDNKVMAFMVLTIIDGGKNVFAHSLVVHEQFEGKGVVRPFVDHLFERCQAMGCRTSYALFDRSTKFRNTVKYKRTCTEEETMFMCSTIIDHSSRANLPCTIDGVRQDGAFKPVSDYDLPKILNDGLLKPVLFPSTRMLVDSVSYGCMEENVPLLLDSNTRFYSSLVVNDGVVSGLLSVGSWYESSSTPMYYTVNLFGMDCDDVRHHLLFHINKAFHLTRGDITLDFWLANGEMAEQIRSITSQYGITFDVIETILTSTRLNKVIHS